MFAIGPIPLASKVNATVMVVQRQYDNNNHQVNNNQRSDRCNLPTNNRSLVISESSRKCSSHANNSSSSSIRPQLATGNLEPSSHLFTRAIQECHLFISHHVRPHR